MSAELSCDPVSHEARRGSLNQGAREGQSVGGAIGRGGTSEGLLLGDAASAQEVSMIQLASDANQKRAKYLEEFTCCAQKHQLLMIDGTT